MNPKTISIIIPVYNEEKVIVETIQKVLESDTKNLKKEIVIVDDKSFDNTKSNIKEFLKITNHEPEIVDEDNKFIAFAAVKVHSAHIIFIQKNKQEGKGSALKIGFLHSTGDIVIVQDADLEYSPSDYPYLLEPFLLYDGDVVYGSRFVSNKPRRMLYFWHNVANNVLTIFSNMFTNLNLTDMETGFKAFKGDLIREIAPKLESKQFGFEPEITARIAKIKELKFYEVGISYIGRTYKEGKKISWVDGVRAVWEIVKFNVLRK